MGCPEKDCCTSMPETGTIHFPDTYGPNTPWKFYNHLIAQIPEGPVVLDYCLGTHWTYVEADCGMGISYTCKGGSKRAFPLDFRGMPLREVAELSKSWCFEEASIGVAALNAWYADKGKLDALGAVYDEPGVAPESSVRLLDAFELYRPRMAGAKVTVIGHFPHVDRIAEYADLTVLERNCTQALDTPDPACEYILPNQDFVFITGTTIINKTAPRLLDIAQDPAVVFVGPSVVMTPFLFDWGAEMLAGSVVIDKEKAKLFVKAGAGKLFGEALQICQISRNG